MFVVAVDGITAQDDMVMLCACWGRWRIFFHKVYFLSKLLFPAWDTLWVAGKGLRSEELPFLVEESKVQLAVIEIIIGIFFAVYANNFDKQTSFDPAFANHVSMPTILHFFCLIGNTIPSECLKMFFMWDQCSLYFFRLIFIGVLYCKYWSIVNHWFTMLC